MLPGAGRDGCRWMADACPGTPAAEHGTHICTRDAAMPAVAAEIRTLWSMDGLVSQRENLRFGK